MTKRRGKSGKARLLALGLMMLGAVWGVAASAGLAQAGASEQGGGLELLRKGLSFYCSFDQDPVAPDIASGAKTLDLKGSSAADGITGGALQIGSTPFGAFAPGNFTYNQGTISLWFRPDGAADATPDADIELFQTENFALRYDASKRRLFFMTGTTLEKQGYKWDYSTAAAIPEGFLPGTWYCLVASWDSSTGRKRMYLDGQLLSDKSTNLMRRGESSSGKPFTVGGKAPMTVDELMIWDHALSDAEVAQFLGNAETAKFALLQAAQQIKAEASTRGVWPVKFELPKITPAKDTIVAPGEEIAIPVKVSNPSDSPVAVKIEFSMLDFWLNRSQEKTENIALNPGQSKTLTLAFTPEKRGCFKIAAKTDLGGQSLEKDVGAFAAWPVPSGTFRQDSFFGCHVNTWANGDFLAQAARLGQGWLRGHNMLQYTWWARIQPEPGAFDWDYDGQRTNVKKFGMPVLGQLFTAPYWAKEGGPGEKPEKGYPRALVPDLEKFRAYVYETVSHFKDEIKYWEIWNEPAVGIFWNGTPAQLAEVINAACEEAKRADPSCVVMAAGYTTPAWKFHEEVAKAGGFKKLDVISLHYGSPLKDAEAVEPQLDAILEHFQNLAKTYGPGRELPVWSTEGGTGDTTWLRGMDFDDLPPEEARSPMTWREGAIATVRGEAIQMSRGIGKHFYYYQNTYAASAKAYHNTNMLEYTNAPRPKLMARVAFEEQVAGAKFHTLIKRDNRVYFVVYQAEDGGSVVLGWAGKNGVSSAPVSALTGLASTVDFMGNALPLGETAEIAEVPGYLRFSTPAEKTAALLREVALATVTPAEKADVADASDKPDVPVLPDFVAPMENPAGVKTIDLRAVCNMGLADDTPGDGKGGWSDEGPYNDMRDMPVGRKDYYGVPFDVIDPATNDGRSIVVLRGSTTQAQPLSVEIPLGGRKFRCLYFLHSAAWGRPGDAGKYIVHYKDGQKTELTINLPANNGNWWDGYDKDETSRPVPVRVTNTTTGKPGWRYIRVWEWENPRGGVEIDKIEMVSNNGPQSPILIGLTGAQW